MYHTFLSLPNLFFLFFIKIIPIGTNISLKAVYDGISSDKRNSASCKTQGGVK